MDARRLVCYYVLALLCVSELSARIPSTEEVVVRTESGWIRGLKRRAEGNKSYASFRGVPYAKQPLGELRFKELQPLEPWQDELDATQEGPVCQQTDVLYGRIMRPRGMSEACIHANIHVPYYALPRDATDKNRFAGLPVLVFIHGGGFAFGSGDSDLHGPEYLVSKDVIVITFNYRLNVYGFLSLNSTSVPGNAGLRDMVTLLKWVQRNAHFFGGRPDDVTLMGQSAGAAATHILSLSKAADGLFRRAILMSGTSSSAFFTTNPVFAQYINKLFVTNMGITATDPEEIHQKLIEMPAEKLNEANRFLLEQFGLTTFFPVVESPINGVTTILDEDPEQLIAKGRGKHIPLIIGFTDAECEIFRRRFEQIDIVSKIKENPGILVPLSVLFSSAPDTVAEITKAMHEKYFKNSVDMEGYIELCTDSYFMYPAISLAIKRARSNGAPVYLYQFSFDGDYSVFRDVNHLNFEGAGHIEDLTYVFRTNSMLGGHASFPPHDKDDHMKYWMTSFITNFMKYSNPVTDAKLWPEVRADNLRYQDIDTPDVYQNVKPHSEQRDMLDFFDSIYNWNGTSYCIK
ncbi:juvenile hormone esterase [Manduca sexta]|nr:juvenile hormone esterase [Manduca sexta]KAG6442067.1 hypothetical protein O3G_MSEX002100 [Manduca sexta]KAG6442068.1 hypothetical protein O3G_MSEX002100 [Manduca sexta]UXP72003.1 esterase [Manduca sexta]